MKVLLLIACGIAFFCLITFYIAAEKWDKEAKQGKEISPNGCGNKIAIVLIILFLLAWIIICISQCSHITNYNWMLKDPRRF